MNRPLSLLICLLLPFIILVAGLVFALIYGVPAYSGALQDDQRAMVPPRFDTILEKPGHYSLWAYPEGTLDGKTYISDPELPPGAKIHVIDKRTGDFLPLNNLYTFTKHPDDEIGNLIGIFETIFESQEVAIVPSGIEKKTVVGISSSNPADIYRVIFTIGAIILLSLFVSLSALVVLLHRRKQQILAAKEKG